MVWQIHLMGYLAIEANKMLDIMKDSRLGTNGGLVLILYFMLKVVLLVEISEFAGLNMGILLLIVPVIARLNSVVNCASAPYAVDLLEWEKLS